MNLRDSYIHGTDQLGVVKKITITTGESTGSYSGKTVLKYTKADASLSTVEVPIGDITGNAGSATKVWVNYYESTTDTTHYPLVWTNVTSTSSSLSNQLYKSSASVYYDVKNKIITALGGFNGGSLVITGNSSLQDISGTTLNISGTSTFSSPINGDLLGNSTTTDRWKNKRTITIGNTGKSIDGSADVSWTLAEIGALAAGSYKTTLTAVSSSTSDGSGTTFVSSVTLDTNGVITVKTKSLDTSGTWSGKATTAGTADLVANSLILKMASGTTEGKDLYTFNGSAGKTINFVAGTGISFTTDATGNFTITNSSPDLNHNTDRYVNSAKFEADTTNNNILMTLTRAGSDLATVTANIPVFGGASSSAAGTSGLVKVPTKGQQGYYLRGDCTWQSISTTDANVTQTATDSTNATYEILFSSTADNTTRTEGTRKTQYLTYNPSTKLLTLSALIASGTVNLNGTTSIDSATIGNLTVSGASTLTGDVSMGTIKQGVWNGTRLTSSYIPTDVVYTGSTLTLTNKTMSTGCTWNGNSIANTYITNHSITIAGTSVDLGGSIAASTIGSALTSSAPAAYATTAAGIDGYTFKTLTKANDSDYASDSADAKIIPTMSFIAYWNGAYNDSGSSNITKVGTISKGTWQGTAIANSYLANSKVTIAGTDVSLGGSISADTLKSNLGLGDRAYDSTTYLPSSLVSASQANITWAQGIANAAATRRAFIYNTNGTEWSYLFGFSSSGTNATYGAVLKMGYSDQYLRILRVANGTWQSTDWEKIYAGYADSSGSSTYASRLGTSSAYLTYDNLSPIYTWYTTELGDTDDKINKWKEVENFLSTVTDSDTIGSILTNYVTIASAQTITGAKTFSNPISGDLLGNSTTADRLKSTTAVGSATQPVYFSGGIPIACTAYGSATVGAANTVKITDSDGDSDYYPVWTTAAGSGKSLYITDANFKYHASNGKLSIRLLDMDTNSAGAVSHINMNRTYNYITAGVADGRFCFITNNKAAGSSANADLLIEANKLRPGTTAVVDLGDSTYNWKNLYLSHSLNVSNTTNYSGADIYGITSCINSAFGALKIIRYGSTNMAAIHFYNGTTGSTYLGALATNTANGKFKRYKTDNSTSYDILDSSDTSVSLSGSTLTVKINGTEKSLTNTNTQYYLTLNGTTNGTASSTNLGTIYAATSAPTAPTAATSTTTSTSLKSILIATNTNTYASSGNTTAYSYEWKATETVSTLSLSTKFLRSDGTWAAPSYTTNTNTASAADNILDGSNSGTLITYAPYSSQQAKLSFDTSSTNPTRTDRLNLNGYLYVTKLYSNASEVVTLAGTQTISGNKTFSGSTSIDSLSVGNLVVNGASSLTGDVSLGTVKLGTWLGGTIGVAYGGTGLTSVSSTAGLALVTNSGKTGFTHSDVITSLGISGTTITWSKNGTTQTALLLPTYTNNVTSHLYAGTTGATSNATSDTTNTTTYLSLVEGTTLDSLIQVTGSGSVSVKTKNGVLTITGTTYTNNVSTPSEAITLVTDTNYSLSTASWQTGPSMTSYSGTYAISIKDSATNTNYYTGLIILNGSTGRNAVEEIPLFSCMATSSDSDTPTRIFAGMKQGVLLLSSQDANGTNHKLTIKILKLIAI